MMDGFEQYAAAPSFNWTSHTAASAVTGRWVGAGTAGAATVAIDSAGYKTTQLTGSSKSMRFITAASTNTCYATAYLGTQTTVFFGAAIYSTYYDWKISFYPGGGSPFSGATNHIRVYSNTSGQIIVYNNYSSTTLLTTAGSTFNINVWQYLEVSLVHGASGSVTVKLDNVTVGTASGVNTTGNPAEPRWEYVTVGVPFSASNNNTTYFDDVYICNDSGSTQNTFLGPTRVYTLFPNANGATNEMTATGAASNWDCVDEQVADTTTYVSTNLANKVENYELPDFSTLPTTVHAVIVGNLSQKLDTGPRFLRNLLVLGGSTSNGVTATPINGQYRWTMDLFVDKPGGTGWAPADLNNIKIGFESL